VTSPARSDREEKTSDAKVFCGGVNSKGGGRPHYQKVYTRVCEEEGVVSCNEKQELEKSVQMEWAVSLRLGLQAWGKKPDGFSRSGRVIRSLLFPAKDRKKGSETSVARGFLEKQTEKIDLLPIENLRQ